MRESVLSFRIPKFTSVKRVPFVSMNRGTTLCTWYELLAKRTLLNLFCNQLSYGPQSVMQLNDF